MHPADKIGRNVCLFDGYVVRVRDIIKVAKSEDHAVAFGYRGIEFHDALQSLVILRYDHDIVVHSGIVYDLQHVFLKVGIVRMAFEFDLDFHVMLPGKSQDLFELGYGNILILSRHPFAEIAVRQFREIMVVYREVIARDSLERGIVIAYYHAVSSLMDIEFDPGKVFAFGQFECRHRVLGSVDVVAAVRADHWPLNVIKQIRVFV